MMDPFAVIFGLLVLVTAWIFWRMGILILFAYVATALLFLGWFVDNDGTLEGFMGTVVCYFVFWWLAFRVLELVGLSPSRLNS
jgi:hypothetical protein